MRRSLAVLAAACAAMVALAPAPAQAFPDGWQYFGDAVEDAPSQVDLTSVRVVHRPWKDLVVVTKLSDVTGAGVLRVDLWDHVGDGPIYRLNVVKRTKEAPRAILRRADPDWQVLECRMGVSWDAAADRIVVRIPGSCGPFPDHEFASGGFSHGEYGDAIAGWKAQAFDYRLHDMEGDAPVAADISSVRRIRRDGVLAFNTKVVDLRDSGRYVVQVQGDQTQSRIVVEKVAGKAPVASLVQRAEGGAWTRSACRPGVRWDAAGNRVSTWVKTSCGVRQFFGHRLAFAILEAGDARDVRTEQWW